MIGLGLELGTSPSSLFRSGLDGMEYLGDAMSPWRGAVEN